MDMVFKVIGFMGVILLILGIGLKLFYGENSLPIFEMVVGSLFIIVSGLWSIRRSTG